MDKIYSLIIIFVIFLGLFYILNELNKPHKAKKSRKTKATCSKYKPDPIYYTNQDTKKKSVLLTDNKVYLIEFNEEVKQHRINEIFNDNQVFVERRFNKLNIYTAYLSDNKLNDLIKYDEIKNICHDVMVSAIPVTKQKISSTKPNQISDWWVENIGANLSSTKSGDKTGDVSNVHVYVLDTGCNHSDLNVVEKITFCSKKSTDTDGHGTHVGGIIGAKDDTYYVVGVAPGVNIHSIKVLGTSGGSMSDIIAGINYVIEQKEYYNYPTVVNMSLGGYAGTTEYNILDNAVIKMINKNIVVCVAAGNDGENASLYTPAHVKEAIVVGAYDNTGNTCSFSNYGDCVTLYAPGAYITSTYLNESLYKLSGTSMASPVVAGVAALYLSNNLNSTPLEVKQALINNCKNTNGRSDIYAATF